MLSQKNVRLQRELALFADSPPHGISCWTKEGSLQHLEAQIIGAETSPYAAGVFKLHITLPDRYPFEPPNIQFVTPIYHPNIDSDGRICLDSLKMPPKGSWSPALNICTLLTTVQLLMSEPNPDDPLMLDIANEFKYNRRQYEQSAREWTDRHAMMDTASSCNTARTATATATTTLCVSKKHHPNVVHHTTHPSTTATATTRASSCAGDDDDDDDAGGLSDARATTAVVGSKRSSTVNDQPTSLSSPSSLQQQVTGRSEGEQVKGRSEGEDKDSSCRRVKRVKLC